jgi:hypothetical protein
MESHGMAEAAASESCLKIRSSVTGDTSGFFEYRGK